MTDASPGDRRPTPAQVAANRMNAQRSTGPRTPAGRARSSQNAMKHGIYARTDIAVERGPFAEDPEEVASTLKELVQALAPRDVLEVFRANRIALLQLQERRVDGCESALLQEEPGLAKQRMQLADEVIEDVRDHVAVWNAARFGDATTQEAQEGDEPPWELMAVWLRGSLERKVHVRGLWDEEHEPTDNTQWRRAFERIARHSYPSPDDMAAFLCVHRDREFAESELRAHGARRRAAMASLSTLEECNRMRARITHELMRQWAMYELLRSREIPTEE